jgi:peptidyl-prolyl cis-trans isomerase SurA
MTGETSFAALARLYSEDGSARQGGEMDYVGRGMLDPNFANVAFNLTDPKKISKIVETEFGYHIIQLIDKRGDKIKVRHILLKPHITDAALKETKNRMDSIADEIKAGKYTFENAATYVSDDKETKNNHGLMAYFDQETQTRTSKFEMKNLPTEIARQVEKMKVGDVSSAFQMINDKGKTVLAVIKLKSRTEGHKANMTEDFQVMKNVVLSKERDKVLHNWVVDKIKHTYVWMNPRYKNCNYEYQGWVK